MSVYRPTAAVITGQEALDLMVGILQRYDVGHLALNGDDFPYVIPLNHTYLDGQLILHGSIDGKKVDMMKHCPRVCYGVYGTQTPLIKPDNALRACSKDYQSIVCYGNIRIENGTPEWLEHLTVISRDFNHRLPEPNDAVNTSCFVIDIVEMTARIALSPEPKVIYSYRFPSR
jgi:nitroimidazol reductase NimA-like FMN-containing flavoprotein (pyridoxamine 5'-phosphate oxidase superfamily)